MAIYKGRVGSRQLAAKLHEALIAEGYTEISSDVATDGRVYSSQGIDGQSPFFIKVKDGSNTSYITTGIYEKYTPNPSLGIAGVFEVGYEGNNLTWNAATTVLDRVLVNYVFNINKDRAILFVEGMKAEPNTQNSLTYLGLPKRYSVNDKGGNAAGMVFTSSGPFNAHNTFRALRNRALSALSDYTMDFYLPNRSYGWGNRLLFSPLYIGSSAEGARGELQSVYVMEKITDSETVHGDTFVKDGKTYMIIVPSQIGNDTLYWAYDYVIEI